MFCKFSGAALVAGLLFLHSSAFGQTYAESALLFSRTQPTGSARIQGLGGTQVSLGGDYSSALSNPAGLGMFNRSEFTFSPAISSYNTNSTYYSGTFQSEPREDNLSKLNIPGLSYVMHIPKDNDGFLGGSFGISLTRVNDFNEVVTYQGRNEESSIVDYFIDYSKGSTVMQFDRDYGDNYNHLSGLAYFNYLIGPRSILDPPGPENEYFTDAPVVSDQREEIITRGTSYQWSFSYGGNYKDILFFGGGIGISTLRHKMQKIYSEQYVDQSIVRDMNLVETTSLRGSGINATIGVIVRPLPFIQAGISFISPTYFQLSETYNASMSSRWNNYTYWDGQEETVLTNLDAATDDVINEHTLTTPLKLNAGLTLISKYGFISADYERTNPDKARYGAEIDGMSFSGDNDEIKNVFKATNSFRFGAELRYNIFRLRGGYGILGDPYAGPVKQKITTTSIGAGLKFKKIAIDFAWVSRDKGSYYYTPYVLSDNTNPMVQFDSKVTTGVITMGFSF